MTSRGLKRLDPQGADKTESLLLALAAEQRTGARRFARLERDALAAAPRRRLPRSPIGGGVSDFPLLLAALVALTASAASLAHALVSSIRRRRRDLAILKAPGVRGATTCARRSPGKRQPSRRPESS